MLVIIMKSLRCDAYRYGNEKEGKKKLKYLLLLLTIQYMCNY